MKTRTVLFFLILWSSSLSAQWTNIRNGALWKDNYGNSVQAHGAGFLNYNGKWYMVGEDRSYWNAGVNLYSTSDFVSWKFENKIIPPSAYSSSRFIERPKLLRCPSTGRFVVWCHYEQGDYGASEAASFYCDSINGVYKLSFSGRPLSIKSRDCNVFVDNDGKGYFVSTTDENQHLTLFELSTDYLSPVKSTRLSTFDWKAREAPAIVRIGNTYFLISSLCTGWDPNQATISYSTSLTSGWSSMTNIGNPITFDTQAASILTVQGTGGTSYLYVGDRWQDPGLMESKTIIFPITFSGTTCTFKYRQQFDMNFTTGLWRDAQISDRVPKTGWKVNAYSSQESSSENGNATNAIDGNLTTKWHTQYSGTTAKAPHFIEVDMGSNFTVSGFHCMPRSDNTNNGIIREFVLTVSSDGTTWTTVAGGSWMPYNSEIYFQPITARYFRLTALSGTYAVVSEIDLLQNTPDFSNRDISPYFNISSGATQQSNSVNMLQGYALNFTPSSPGTGTWAWNGPNNNTSVVRTFSIPNVVFADSGRYTGCFLDVYSKISKVDFNVTVNVDLLSYRRKLNYVIKRAQAVYDVSLLGSLDLINCITQSQIMTYSSSGATREQLENQSDILEAKLKTYIFQNVTNAENKTGSISTPSNFLSTTPIGWSGSLTGYGSGCGEFYNDSTFIFSQVVSNLPNGKYLVGVKAFYRSGENDAGDGYANSNERQYATLNAGDKSIFLSSLYSTPYSGITSLNGFCNTLAVSNSLFSNANGYYDNWILANVMNNTLNVKLSKAIFLANDWIAFNNFQLFYLNSTSAIVDSKTNNFVNDDRIFSIDGKLLGKGEIDLANLRTGIYIQNGKKLLITK